jgi:hypothetical protein
VDAPCLGRSGDRTADALEVDLLSPRFTGECWYVADAWDVDLFAPRFAGMLVREFLGLG